VLGVALTFVLVVGYSCTGTKESPAANPGSTASPKATGSILTPTSESPTSEPTGEPKVDATSAAPTTLPGAPAAGACTDAEMSVTPVPSRTSAVRGMTINLQLKIKNVSGRTCERDVGADMQELYITLGAQKIWSSDKCGTGKGSDVQSFPPNIAHTYQVGWNGRTSTRCANGVATGPYPAPGEYQLFGRLGTKLSAPVKLTITD